jgi:Putative Flp pilus-assembly TadE/G-like
MGLWRWISGSGARRFSRAKGGNVAMLWALCGAVLIGLTGLTVDFTRAQSIRAQLQNAADGAVLVAERMSDQPLDKRTEAAQAFFNAEIGDLAAGAHFQVTPLDSGGHRVDASYPMPLSLARIIRNEDWNIAVSSEAEAQASPPIEVALALDNTGSMSGDMQTLRDGAKSLAEYLLGIDGDSVSVGLVPFVAQVNIGTSHTSWIDTAGDNPYNGVLLAGRYMGSRNNSSNSSSGNCNSSTDYPTSYGGFAIRWIKGSNSNPSAYNNNKKCYAFSPEKVNVWSLYDNLPSSAQWGGCVESRPPPYDISDAAPSSGATKFVPFFSLDDGGDVSSPDNNWITSSTYDKADIMSIGSGSPSFTYNSASDLVRTLGVYKYRSGVSVSNSSSNSNGRGPNRGCPTPIVPLTTDHDAVVNAIQNMTYWNGGGTNQIEGLAWAWRVLSPGEPFTEGRPYDDPDNPVRKVIVLFTDGDNTSLNSKNDAMESDYAGLGYRSLWRTYQTEQVPVGSGSSWQAAVSATYQRTSIGLNGSSNHDASAMVGYMNERQQALCDAIKAKNIEIYTIGFRIQSGGTADQLLQGCATQDSKHFFHANNQSQLLDAFHAIGSGIGDLRLTR